MTTQTLAFPSPASTGERKDVALSALRPHPHNARRPIKPKDVEGLAKNIEQRGQLSPVVVRQTEDDAKDGTYQVLAGHRRVAALASLGRETAACLIVTADDDEALRIVVSENHDRAEPDLFYEADTVKELLSRAEWNEQSVADHLGKPRGWVAQRKALARIDESIRKKYESGKHEWSPRMMELLAHVATDAQASLIAECPWALNGEDSMERAVVAHLRTLDRAPWDLADETLNAKAGTCSSCPKQSANERGLFGIADDKALKPKDSRCLDAKCWGVKMLAHVRRIASKHAGDKPLLYVMGENVALGEDVKHDRLCPEDAVVLRPEQFSVVKSDTKDAEPALVVSGKGQGSLVHVLVGRARATGKGKTPKGAKGDAKAKDAPTLADRETTHARRVSARALELFREFIGQPPPKMPVPTTEQTLILATIYGARVSPTTYESESRAESIIESAAKERTGAETATVTLWSALNSELRRALEPFKADDAVPKWNEAKALAKWLGIDVEPIVAKANEDVPPPASLVKARAGDAKPEKKKAAKNKAAKKKK